MAYGSKLHSEPTHEILALVAYADSHACRAATLWVQLAFNCPLFSCMRAAYEPSLLAYAQYAPNANMRVAKAHESTPHVLARMRKITFARVHAIVSFLYAISALYSGDALRPSQQFFSHIDCRDVSWIKTLFATEHNTVHLERLEPVTPQSQGSIDWLPS